MSVTALLDLQSVIVNLNAPDSTAVIRQLGGRLFQEGLVRNGFVEATLAREASAPTGLPLGGEYNAALPHVDVEYVIQSSLALATLPKPVVFQNMVDRQQAVPVQLVIMLALADSESQVEMLGQVATILQQPQAVADLVRAKSVDEIFALLHRIEAL